MDLMNKATVHASEVISARDTIQTPYSEFNVGADLPKISEADLAKLAKRAEKEEKQRRIALAQHQVMCNCSSSKRLQTCQGQLLPSCGPLKCLHMFVPQQRSGRS